MKYWYILIVMAAAHACYTEIDIKASVCWALCRQDGADTGSYSLKDKTCLCGYKHDFGDYTKAAFKIYPVPKETYWRPKD